MRHPLFTLYGLFLAAAAGWTSWRGFTFSRVDQATVAPKSIRDNPGAYRPIYIPHRRYFGGK
jgi:hypothetical protein